MMFGGSEGHVGNLLGQIAWFNKLRLVAVIGMMTVTILANQLGVIDEIGSLCLLAGIALAVDIIYFVRFPKVMDLPEFRVRRHVQLQIAIDLLILTGVLHLSGGVTNPFVLFYVFHACIAALLLSVGAAFVVSGVSLVAVGLLSFLEMYDVLPHHPINLGWVSLERMGPFDLLVWLAVFGATLVFTAYLVASVASKLVRREDEVMFLGRKLAHSEKMVSVGTLAAGVSHEINNPVGVIQNKARILRYRINDGESPEKLLGELDVIEKHTGRIRSITEGLLTFSRETPFELKEIDLNTLVTEGADLVEVPYQNGDIRLELDLDESIPPIHGSSNHLLQVLVNIMLNARDASECGGLVRVQTARSGGEVLTTVIDTGSGIDPDDLPKIFDPFFTTKEVDRGTGLGLAISHGIVERHGGRIDVASRSGEGSSFSMILPVSRSGSRRRFEL